MAWLSDLKRDFQRLGKRQVPRADRWPVSGLTAFYGADSPSTQASIKNISSNGIYLGVQEHLNVGQLLNLKLQIEGDSDSSSELRIAMQAHVIRQDEFGAGLMFVLPQGLDAALWEVLVRGAVVLTDAEHVVQVIRTLRIVLFLSRLCPSGAEEAMLLLDGQLDQNRSNMLFRIACHTENLLAADPDGGRMRADHKLVASLLRDGSWAPDELTAQLWEGLFISSCMVEEPDDSNLIFVDLLTQITTYQARIFVHACERALKAAPASGDFAPAPVVLSPDEITRLTGVTDLARNATDLAYLFNLGLIHKLFDFTSYREIDSFDVTPSRLGVELYRHCQGQRGKVDPQLAEAGRKHLEALIPPPLPNPFEDVTPPVPDSPPKNEGVPSS
jgi:hypothetical protein